MIKIIEQAASLMVFIAMIVLFIGFIGFMLGKR